MAWACMNVCRDQEKIRWVSSLIILVNALEARRSIVLQERGEAAKREAGLIIQVIFQTMIHT